MKVFVAGPRAVSILNNEVKERLYVTLLFHVIIKLKTQKGNLKIQCDRYYGITKKKPHRQRAVYPYG